MLPLTNSKACEVYLRNIWEYNTINYEERVYVVFLDTKGRRIDYKLLDEGRYAECKILCEKVLKIVQKAIKLKSKHIIIAHNHPSGSVRPSEKDISCTNELVNTLSKLDIEVIDHIILTEDSYFSFKDNNLLNQLL